MDTNTVKDNHNAKWIALRRQQGWKGTYFFGPPQLIIALKQTAKEFKYNHPEHYMRSH